MVDPAASSTPRPGRRQLLRWSGVLTAAAVTGGLSTAGTARAAQPPAVQPLAASTFSPLRPPAVPLAVRSPYHSTWVPADNLAGTWATFWTGHVTALCGLARIDGAAYVFAGSPALPGGPALTTMQQLSLQLTATRSIYTLSGGGVTLTVTFFSPVDLGNLQRQSVPLSYITVQAASNDGRPHNVDVHVDVSGEWAHGNINTPITWAQQQSGQMTVLSAQPASPAVLREDGDQAAWGQLVLAAPTGSGTSWQIGQDTVVRTASVSGGRLSGTVDSAQPRAIKDRWPVLGFHRDFGTVSPGTSSAAFTLVLGHVRTPAVSYLGTPLQPWWTHYWGQWTDMVAWFSADHGAALTVATALDQRIHDDAVAAAGGGTTGEHYAAVCALALRQAVASAELVDRGGSPWAFQKEISSSGNMSTVDVVYPTFPVYLYLSPDYLRMLLEPLLDYPEHGGWPNSFAEHDLGRSYPNADGHDDGNEESMPVEESANMLIMAAAVVQRLPGADASAFARAHYPILRRWAEYLSANALDPGYQNQTDDFTGFIAHSSNLALKDIIGIGAMGVIATAAGNTADAARYSALARSYISRWTTLSEDSSGQHLKLAYDQDGTWSLKYNGFPDRLLGLNLVPAGTEAREASWYSAHAGTYGVVLDPRNDYTKADWELWTAAWLADHPATRDTLVNGVYDFADSTAQRTPFTDWYVVATAAQRGFAARAVVGGVFALLLPPAASGTLWRRIQNRNSEKVLAVSGMSLADTAEVTQYADNGTADHLWTLIDNADGTVRIANRNSGKVLAVHDQSLDNGAHVQQYQDNGTPDHVWRIVDDGDGWSKIVNVRSGKLLAVDGMSGADAAQVTQWEDNGSADHLWRFL
ncbi:DUF5127 domain-containing protein [Streptomyces sp. NPDC046985]|uniref:glutaminase domain-containing protein n=1 Tax=Streptomyces sp. NPDC046985 TaxID=3155377 RepID=UPI00340CF701